VDDSGLSSGIALVISLLALAYVRLVEAANGGKSGRISHAAFSTSLWTAPLIAAAASAALFFYSFDWMSWPLAALLFLGLLGLIAGINLGVARFAQRYPVRVRSFIAFFRGHAHRKQETLNNGMQLADPPAFAQEIAPEVGDEEEDVVIVADQRVELDPRERSMIRSILELDEYTARDIMVPRVDIVAVEASDSVADVARLMLDKGHSRLPVYQETIDNIVGVVHSRDLLSLLVSPQAPPPLEKLWRQAYFVPDSKRLDRLLADFQKLRVQMALVVDEHGGIAGLVTLEDLLEEIVGEIDDEYSPATTPRVMRADNGDLIVDARVSLYDLEEYLPLAADDLDVDTIGGLVYSKLGKIPQTGDEVSVDSLRIRVMSTVGRRLGKLRVIPQPPAPVDK
jgi:CBS domain containing-hemolysin-like protein